jgi:hypothetical protein
MLRDGPQEKPLADRLSGGLDVAVGAAVGGLRRIEAPHSAMAMLAWRSWM